MRIEAREDCIAFLCECRECHSPIGTLRRDRNVGLRIESQHHGYKHINLLTAEDLAWAHLYLSGQEDSIIREELQLSAQPDYRDVKLS